MRFLIKSLDYECIIDAPFDLGKEWKLWFTPFCEIVKIDTIDVSPQFCVQENPEFIHQLLQKGRKQDFESITLHSGLLGEIVSTEGGKTLILVNELRVAYMVEGKAEEFCVHYFCEKISDLILLDLYRLIRGILIGTAQRSGKKWAHMSVATVEGHGIAFVGPKGAGKTSFMLALLSQLTCSSLLANDKVLLSQDGKGTVTGTGHPDAVSIGLGALNCCEELLLVNRENRVVNDKVCFWPQEIANYLNRDVVPCARLSFIVSVQIDPSRADLTCSRIIEPHMKKEFIVTNVINFSSKIYPHWLLKILDIKPAPEKRFVDLLTQNLSYEISGNPWNGNLKPMILKLIASDHKY